MVCCLTASAQTDPVITMKAPVDGTTLTLGFITQTDGVTLSIDWGDGTLVPTDPIKADDGYQSTTDVIGTPVGTGEVKIYGETIILLNCAYHRGGAKITELNVTNAPSLKYLYAATNLLTQLDVSKNVDLETIELSNDSLTTIDVTACTKLRNLTLTSNKLTSIDLSKNPELNTLYLSKNPISSVDLSANNKLKYLYALNCGMSEIKFGDNTTEGLLLSLNNNNFTSFDASGLQTLESLSLNNNQLTELKLSEGFVANTAKYKTLNITGNRLTYATIPAAGTFASALRFNYAPQQPIEVAQSFAKNDVLDLSAQNNIQGILDAPVATTYGLYTLADVALTEGTDYSVAEGKITFLNAQADSVYVGMTTTAYPKAVGTKMLKTTPFIVSDPTAIKNVGENALAITAENGVIRVSGLANGQTVTVFDLAGKAIAALKSKGSEASAQLPRGIYLVKTAGKTVKVTL